MSDNLICGFVKIRNAILRGDLYRLFLNLDRYCDDIFVCDDASYDGTSEFLYNYLPEDHILSVPYDEWSFKDELKFKQELLTMVHQAGPYKWIFWLDGDEVLDAKGTQEIRDWCEKHKDIEQVRALAFHYTQFWRNSKYARTDNDFDSGQFIKLWKYEPHIEFEIKAGTHQPQFPKQVFDWINQGKVLNAPWEILHYGNVGQNLKWKILQYYGGLGGVSRHMDFEEGKYREVDQKLIPEGAEKIGGDIPEPFTKEQKTRMLAMKDLHHLEETFCIIIPTYNRAEYLERTLDSIYAQSYEKWICVILDDGSTDNTYNVIYPYLEADPRFFYGRYLDRSGGVHMNEIGMDIACHTADYWVRLGSDDWFEPTKLERDKIAFDTGAKAIYGPFQVHRDGALAEIGNLPIPGEDMREMYLRGGFSSSWANVAVHTSILKEIKKRFGNYVDPRLVNMEDKLFNARVTLCTPWVWRGEVNNKILVNPSRKQCEQIVSAPMTYIKSVEGYWNVNTIGASANTNQYAIDDQLSNEIIKKDLA